MMLYTKYQDSMPCGLDKKMFLHFPYIILGNAYLNWPQAQF